MKKKDTILCRVSLIDHVRQAWPIAVFALAPVITPILTWNAYGPQTIKSSFLVGAGFFVLILVPHIALHIKYTLINAGMVISFDTKQRLFTVLTSDGHSETIRDTDISCVVHVVPRSLAFGEIALYPWQAYGYAKFQLTSGNSFIVTTLLVKDLIWPFQFKSTSRKISPYCWPS